MLISSSDCPTTLRWTDFGVDPVDVSVVVSIGVTLSYLHNILRTSGQILTNFLARLNNVHEELFYYPRR